jgi:tetratricopeptide (TPR) repeat protein
MLFLGLNLVVAQNTQEEDIATLSMFDQYAKAKNYDAAYGPWMELRTRNPNFSRAIYVHGENILEYKIEKSTGSEKVAFIKDLVKLWEERQMYFASKTPKGQYMAKACQLQYDHRKELNMTDVDLYNCFDTAYKADTATFTSPKSLYTYFSLMVDLYDAGKKPAKDLFNKYDDISEKIESEIKNYTQKLNKFVPKDDEEEVKLNPKDARRVKSYNSYVAAYNQIATSVDSKLGERANCENLIPLYNRDFEENKSDGVWLQRAAGRMSAKDCTDDPLFFKLVNAYHNLSPSANSAYYLGILKDKEGKSNEAIAYYNQAVDLETDSYEKAKILNKIAGKFRKKGSYGQARSYYRKALAENPSLGSAHIAIAAMYAKSAKDCGNGNFNQRAVYWLAAQEVRKAGRVDASLRKAAAQNAARYEAQAPSKSEIFSAARNGETIKIGCWINASVKVPNF